MSFKIHPGDMLVKHPKSSSTSIACYKNNPKSLEDRWTTEIVYLTLPAIIISANNNARAGRQYMLLDSVGQVGFDELVNISMGVEGGWLLLVRET